MNKKFIVSIVIMLSSLIISSQVLSSPISGALKCDTELQCGVLSRKLKKTAKAGSPMSQALLALSYRSGELSTVDPRKAWRWLNRSMRKDFAPAYFIAATWYAEGYHIEVNHEKAIELLNLSAEHGYIRAKKLLKKLEDRNLESAGIEKVQLSEKNESSSIVTNMERIEVKYTPEERLKLVLDYQLEIGFDQPFGPTGSHIPGFRFGEGPSGTSSTKVFNKKSLIGNTSVAEAF